MLCNIREIAASPAGEGVEKYIHPFLSFFFVAVGVIFAFYRASTREVGAASPLDKNDTEEADWEEEWPSSFEIARKLWDEDVELSGLRFEFDWDGEITRVHYRHKLDNGEEVLIDGKADSMLYVPEEMQNILNSGENPKLRKGRIVKVDEYGEYEVCFDLSNLREFVQKNSLNYAIEAHKKRGGLGKVEVRGIDSENKKIRVNCYEDYFLPREMEVYSKYIFVDLVEVIEEVLKKVTGWPIYRDKEGSIIKARVISADINSSRPPHPISNPYWIKVKPVDWPAKELCSIDISSQFEKGLNPKERGEILKRFAPGGVCYAKIEKIDLGTNRLKPSLAKKSEYLASSSACVSERPLFFLMVDGTKQVRREMSHVTQNKSDLKCLTREVSASPVDLFNNIEKGSLGLADSIAAFLGDNQTSKEIFSGDTRKQIFNNGGNLSYRKEMYPQENDSALGGNRIAQDIAEVSVTSNEDERVFLYGFVDFLVGSFGINVSNIRDFIAQGFKTAGDTSGTISINEEFHRLLNSLRYQFPLVSQKGSIENTGINAFWSYRSELFRDSLNIHSRSQSFQNDMDGGTSSHYARFTMLNFRIYTNIFINDSFTIYHLLHLPGKGYHRLKLLSSASFPLEKLVCQALNVEFIGGIIFASPVDNCKKHIVVTPVVKSIWQIPNFLGYMNAEQEEAVKSALIKVFRNGIKSNDQIFIDLMSGSNSYFPRILRGKFVGIGLNETELKANGRLSESPKVQDLNLNHRLDFPDDVISGALMVNGIAYAERPLVLFREVNRVLKPKANFAVVFDHRSKHLKRVYAWNRAITDLEKIELVKGYFAAFDKYCDINVERVHSWKGYPTSYYIVSASKVSEATSPIGESTISLSDLRGQIGLGQVEVLAQEIVASAEWRDEPDEIPLSAVKELGDVDIFDFEGLFSDNGPISKVSTEKLRGIIEQRKGEAFFWMHPFFTLRIIKADGYDNQYCKDYQKYLETIFSFLEKESKENPIVLFIFSPLEYIPQELPFYDKIINQLTLDVHPVFIPTYLRSPTPKFNENVRRNFFINKIIVEYSPDGKKVMSIASEGRTDTSKIWSFIRDFFLWE